MCRTRRDYGINTIDDTTINSDDINRYQKRADIFDILQRIYPYRHTSRFFSLSPIRCLLLPRTRSLTTLSTTCPVAFPEELFIAIPHRDSPSLPLYPSLRKQFIRLFVFRLDVPRGLSRFLSVVLPFLLPCLDVPVTFSSDLGTRLNCFPIRHLSNVRSRRTQRKFVPFVLYLLCKSPPPSRPLVVLLQFFRFAAKQMFV